MKTERNPIRKAQMENVVSYLRNVLADMKAGNSPHHVELETFFKFYDGQVKRSCRGFKTKWEFCDYLHSEVIPKLEKAHDKGRVEDFEFARAILSDTFKATYRGNPDIQKWVDRGYDEVTAQKLVYCEIKKHNMEDSTVRYVQSNTTALYDSYRKIELMTRIDNNSMMDHEGKDMVSFHHPVIGCFQIRISPEGQITVIAENHNRKPIPVEYFGHPYED
jgi:hypothetical protein